MKTLRIGSALLLLTAWPALGQKIETPHRKTKPSPLPADTANPSA